MPVGGGHPKIKVVHDQQTATKEHTCLGGQWLCSMYLSQQLHQGELHKLLIIVIMLWNYLFFVSEDTTSNLSEQMVVRKSFSKIADH